MKTNSYVVFWAWNCNLVRLILIKLVNIELKFLLKFDCTPQFWYPLFFVYNNWLKQCSISLHNHELWLFWWESLCFVYIKPNRKFQTVIWSTQYFCDFHCRSISIKNHILTYLYRFWIKTFPFEEPVDLQYHGLFL